MKRVGKRGNNNTRKGSGNICILSAAAKGERRDSIRDDIYMSLTEHSSLYWLNLIESCIVYTSHSFFLCSYSRS